MSSLVSRSSRTNNQPQTPKPKQNPPKKRPWPCWARSKVYEKSLAGLTQQIEDFVAWVSPTKEEAEMRRDAVSRVSAVVKAQWPEATVEVIGSCSTNLCVPTSDIDLVIFGVPNSNTLKTLYMLANKITPLASADTLQVLDSAKVPIIKMTDLRTGADIDISLSVTAGKENTQVVNDYVAQYPLLRPLTLVIKYYLKHRFLNNPWSGGIGSYTLVLMIINYLQLHAREGDSLANHLTGFFRLYGKLYDYKHSVISVKGQGSYLSKAAKGWDNPERPNLLSVEDPHCPENDVGALAFQIDKVKEAFSDAYDQLLSAYPSLLVHYEVSPVPSLQPLHVQFCRSISFDSTSSSYTTSSDGHSHTSSDGHSPDPSRASELYLIERATPIEMDTLPSLSLVLSVNQAVQSFRTKIKSIYGEVGITPPNPRATGANGVAHNTQRGKSKSPKPTSTTQQTETPPKESKKLTASDFPDLSLSNLCAKQSRTASHKSQMVKQ